MDSNAVKSNHSGTAERGERLESGWEIGYKGDF